MNKAASKQNVRTTNIVFRRKRIKNFAESTPDKGAFWGNMVKGPFTKNFVMPNAPVKRLRSKVYTANGIEFSLLPKEFFG